MKRLTKMLRPLLTLAAVAVAALALSACNQEEHFEVAAGEPVMLGEVEYQVVFSRLLNIHDTEDRDYLSGREPPPPGSSYLGIFIQIENEADEGVATIPEDIRLVDTDGDVFEPIETESIFALELGGEIAAGDSLPAPDSPAQTGPIGGSLIPFEITDAATENRPLTLIIPGPDEDARVELDI